MNKGIDAKDIHQVTYKVHEAAEKLGCSENFIRDLIASGDAPFPVLRVSRRRFIRIPRRPFDAWVEGRRIHKLRNEP